MKGNLSAWILGGGIAALGALYIYLNLEPNIPIRSAAKAPEPSNPDSVPGGEQTAEYNRLQLTADDQRADAAWQQGRSAMPSPPTLDELLVQNSGDPPVQADDKAPSQPDNTRQSRQSRTTQAPLRDEQYAASVERQINELINYRDHRFAALPTSMMTYQDKTPPPAPVVQSTGQTPLAVIPADQRGQLNPGDILYAVLQTAINSDEPSPVRARVVGDRFKGAILMGSLNSFPPVVGSRPEKVLVRFSTMTWKKQVYDLDSYAIDPETTRTALADDVDHHYLSRWGALVAASFLEGYGNAIRNANRNTTVGIFGNVVTTPKNDLDDDDIAKEAIGTVGERLGDAVGQYFNRPNTIRVNSGTALGVLIVSPSNTDTQQTAPELSAVSSGIQSPVQGTSVVRQRYSNGAVQITLPNITLQTGVE